MLTADLMDNYPSGYVIHLPRCCYVFWFIYLYFTSFELSYFKAGNIIGLSGNKDLLIGETLIDWKYKNLGFPFETFTQRDV